MADASQTNEAKYKAGFGSTQPELVKTTPLRIVPGFTAEQMNALGMKQESYPTPINPHLASQSNKSK